jgi:6-pyruvoyltetrahydropterin/6-carboxytetrahydropterin synthase
LNFGDEKENTMCDCCSSTGAKEGKMSTELPVRLVRFLEVTRKFDAAHHLTAYMGNCSRCHGHTWKIRFKFAHRKPMPDTNMAFDFRLLKTLLAQIIPDHQDLNEYYAEENPTAEFLAERIFTDATKELESQIPAGLFALVSVQVFESDDCSATAQDYDRVGMWGL